MFLIDYETSCDLVRKGASEGMSESKSRSVITLPSLLVIGTVGEEIESS